MDLQELLRLADQNKAAAQREASVKRYSTTLAPPKKAPKSNVQSAAIKQFLARKEAESKQKEEEARKKRDELLALRAQNTKSNKKAKIMASRTKDNDFSKIKLTEEELEAKRRREAELLRLSLNDKVQRMKARIEMEEKEKLLPKKRKRKSKQIAENNQEQQDETADFDHADCRPVAKDDKYPDKSYSKSQQNIKKPRLPPAQPSLSFQELLKLAEKKQHEPVVMPKVKKDDDRPLTKKEKRLLAEEESRLRKKMTGQPVSSSKPILKVTSNNATTKNDKIAISNVAKKHSSETSINPTLDRKPTVIRVQKEQKADASESSTNGNTSFNHFGKSFLKKNQSGKLGPPVRSDQSNYIVKQKEISGSKDKVISSKGEKQRPPESFMNKNKTDHDMKKTVNNKIVAKKQKTESSLNRLSNGISQEMLEEIKRQIHDQVKKEFEAKMKECKPTATSGKGENVSSAKVQNKQTSDPPFRTNGQTLPTSENPSSSSLNKSALGTKVISEQRPSPKDVMSKQKQASMKPNGMRREEVPSSKKLVSKPHAPPERLKKPAFHPNPYLEPPRRLLESRRPPKRMKRRLESDDEDEDDDDMSDFIDDGPVQGEQEEEYSKYIQELFNYDPSRYADDDDDDDIIETSFAEQMKEEVRSAKIGYLEDLEDMKKEEEEMRRKKMKKKKK